MSRFAIADPPYVGQARRHYRKEPEYDGEVDHAELIQQLGQYDGWALHCSSPSLQFILPLCPEDVRICAWVKPFAAFKKNIPVAYAWEPIIIASIRKQQVGRLVRPLRDYVSCPITMKKGLTGVKPEAVCWHVFEWLGCLRNDSLFDLFPGTGAITKHWEEWRRLLYYPDNPLYQGIDK
jgi:hypothetical protein